MNNIKKNNIDEINAIIKILKDIKQSEDIEQYRIGLKQNIYTKQDNRGMRRKITRNGTRIIIKIEKGLLINEIIDHIGTKILEDDTDIYF